MGGAIMRFLASAKHGKASLEKCKAVQEEMFKNVDEFIFDGKMN